MDADKFYIYGIWVFWTILFSIEPCEDSVYSRFLTVDLF